MNVTKEQADKVIAALSMNRIMARDENGNYTKEITAQVVVEALTIMRGLAEDAEPQIDYSVIYEFADKSNINYNKLCVMVRAATSPQAAQTALKSESSAQAAQAPARLPGEGKTIEALAPTEAQEREAWLRVCREIIDRWVAPDMYKYAVAMLDLAIQADQAGRAWRKG